MRKNSGYCIWISVRNKYFPLYIPIFIFHRLSCRNCQPTLSLVFLYKHQKIKKCIKLTTTELRVQTYQILTNDEQMLILCLSYFITTVLHMFIFFHRLSCRNCKPTLSLVFPLFPIGKNLWGPFCNINLCLTSTRWRWLQIEAWSALPLVH